jgi:hypothetical protein
MALAALKLASKSHLMSVCCVLSRLKILTYYRVCSVFESAYAWPTNIIWGFETSFTNIKALINPLSKNAQILGLLSKLVVHLRCTAKIFAV